MRVSAAPDRRLRPANGDTGTTGQPGGCHSRRYRPAYAGDGAARRWNLWDLERRARDEAQRDPLRYEEWSYLFVHLRQFATPDGFAPHRVRRARQGVVRRAARARRSMNAALARGSRPRGGGPRGCAGSDSLSRLGMSDAAPPPTAGVERGDRRRGRLGAASEPTACGDTVTRRRSASPTPSFRRAKPLLETGLAGTGRCRGAPSQWMRARRSSSRPRSRRSWASSASPRRAGASPIASARWAGLGSELRPNVR